MYAETCLCKHAMMWMYAIMWPCKVWSDSVCYGAAVFAMIRPYMPWWDLVCYGITVYAMVCPCKL